MLDKKKVCGNCALCVHFSYGGVCALTDNEVDYNQAACIDYINNED